MGTHSFREWLREGKLNEAVNKNPVVFEIRQNSKKSNNIYGYYIDSYEYNGTDLSKNTKEQIMNVLAENLNELKSNLEELERKYSKYSAEDKKSVQVEAMKYQIKEYKNAIKLADKQFNKLNKG